MKSLRAFGLVLFVGIAACGMAPAAPQVMDIAPPAQAWKFQRAESPAVAPVASEWQALDSFRNLFKPDPAGPEWDSVWYETEFEVPKEARDRAVWLGFQHIRGVARVYVGDQFVKELVRPDWEVDVSRFVRPGQKVPLRIFVTRTNAGTDATERDDLILPGVMQKFYTLKHPRTLGLMGRVEVMMRGRTSWLASAWVESIWNPRSIKVHVEGDGAAEGMRVTGEILDAAGKVALRLPETPFVPGETEIATPWEKVIPWELGRGTLYTLHLKLLGPDGRPVDELPPVTFGFREVRVEGRNFLINGVPVRWRLSPLIWFDLLRRGGDCEPGTVKAIDFLAETGFNVLEVQPHPQSFWSRDNGPWPVYDETLLAEADRRGIGLTIGAPHFTKHWLDYGVGSESAVRAQYRREFETFIRRYRNHPSILAWVGAMNFFDVEYGARANTPWGMGTAPTERQQTRPVHRIIQNGERIMERSDPARPSYSHHGGNSGAIASSNQHMCLTPIAELEKWPSAWAKDGTKPWIAVEFGVPYWADFWMKNRSEKTGALEPGGEAAITEFAALTLGDEAYAMESESLRKKLASLSRANTSGHGSEKIPPQPTLRVDGNILDLPAVRAVFADYGRRVNRSWRTWGVTGWSPWLLSWGLRYRGNPESFMPDVVQAYRETNQPLLAYVGGAPEFYLRARNFRSGEPVEKSAIFVWDGPGSLDLRATWEATMQGAVVASGRFQQKLDAQSVTHLPFSFPAPAVTERTPLEIKLTVDSQETDVLPVVIWPAAEPAPVTNREVVLCDPAGESGWVTTLVPGVRVISEAEAAAVDPAKTLLILGRRSLEKLARLPYTAEQITAGLRVIVLEQSQAALLRLGLRGAERGLREGMGLLPGSPVFAGLSPEDFRDWRGSATLLSETEDFRWWSDLDKLDAFNPARTARWGTHGNVSSVQIETPQKGHFVPLLRCGFDMAYSPLLEWRQGDGGIWFCQLDLTGRVGVEPPATRVATNLLSYASGTLPAANRALFLQGLDEALARKVTELGFLQAAAPGDSVVEVGVVARETGIQLAPGNGGAAPEGTQWTGLTRIAPEQIRMTAGTEPPPNLRRFRMRLQVLEQPGAIALALDGTKGFLGVPLDAADGPYADDLEKNHARLTRWRIRQLYGWMFSQACVQSAPEVTARLMELSAPESGGEAAAAADLGLIPLRDVKVSQALRDDGREGASLLDAALPDLVFEDQKALSARKDVFAYGGDDATGGYVDLAKLLGVIPAPTVGAVVQATVTTAEARPLTVRLGADYWGTVRLNGEEILRLDKQVGPPLRDAAQVTVPFKAGDNRLEVRVVSGSSGFGCWLDVTESTAPLPRKSAVTLGAEPYWGTAMRPYDAPGFSLYTEPMRKRDDPYAWKSW
ncbi:MAG: hypothetical protein IAE94_11280 [Chthoniobacterales bacterium]|nr:hypothetical protein [Chthoniobacterales bacterium]